MAETDPLIPEWEEDYDLSPYDDDDKANQTGAFGPLSSTPAPDFLTAQNEKDGLQQLSFFEDLSGLPGLSTTSAAEGEIFKEFPNADKDKIKYMMDDKGRAKVGLISPRKPYYNLLTQIPGRSGEYRINPQLPKEVLRALGESHGQTIQTEIEKLSEGINENKKIAANRKTKQKEINPVKEHKGKFHPGLICKDNWIN